MAALYQVQGVVALMALWDDQGPASQGKILTAIMQDDEAKASALMHRWTAADLETLERAAYRLAQLARLERERPRR